MCKLQDNLNKVYKAGLITIQLRGIMLIVVTTG